MLTARDEIEDRTMGLEVGADSYIPKHFYPKHLRIRVEKPITLREQFRKTFSESDENISCSELLMGLMPCDQMIIESLVELLNEILQIPDLNSNE